MYSTWRNPVGIVNRAGSKGPSTSCVTRISLMEVCSFFVLSGSVIASSEVIFHSNREASFRLPVVYEFDLFDRHVPSCQKGMGMDSLICGAPPVARNTGIKVDKPSVGHHLLSIRF